MDRIQLNLESCYGIKLLKTDFDFSEHPAIAIYAPNGMMKSSLARTLGDLATPSDRIYTDSKTVCEVKDESGKPLSQDSILVFGPYDGDLDPTQRISNLLLSKKLKKDYDALISDIDKAKDALLKAVKKTAQTKLNGESIEADISNSVMRVGNEFLPALVRLRSEISKQDATPYAQLKYDMIFDPRILEFIGSQTGKDAISNYVTRYNALLDASHFFSRANFNYYGAEQVAKSLADHGFFKENHVVWLKSRSGNNSSKEIHTREELANVIEEEKASILKDAALTKEFDAFASKANRNEKLREFVAYLQQNPTWLVELENPEKFKTEVWKSYLKVQFSLYTDLLDKYESAEPRLKELKASAASEKTRWESVVREFNERFVVPFTLAAKNKADACVGEHTHVELSIKFTDGPREVEVDRKRLIDVLSMGQRKAFYILNILFELFSRKEDGRETLIVFDDIADSFDYQNKYAIIQYLQDLNEDGKLFKQIIMTHNFDFLRTMVYRHVVVHKNCFMANKNANGEIVFEEAKGVKDMFFKVLKDEFSINQKRAIACIPFLRNLRELQIDDMKDSVYLRLTALLHWKPGQSDIILRKDLDQAFESVFENKKVQSANGHERMVDIIQLEAEDCLTAPEGVNFDNKLILSIAIRLLSDRFMANKIADDAFVNAITGRHTNKLFDKFIELFPNDNALDTLRKVILMTPENIHLNSFMYEPIIDMSDHHLRKLYEEVRDLTRV